MAGGRRRYQLLLLGARDENHLLVSERRFDVGDQVVVDDSPYEVIGLIWNQVNADEGLLCRRITGKAVAPRDEPTTRERAWWSTRWHS